MNSLIWALLAFTEPNLCDSSNGRLCPGITVRQVKESPCTVSGPNCCPSALQRIEGKLYWGRLFGDFVVPAPKIQVLRNEIEPRNRQLENTQGLLLYIIHRSVFEKLWNTRKNNVVSVWGTCRLLYTTQSNSITCEQFLFFMSIHMEVCFLNAEVMKPEFCSCFVLCFFFLQISTEIKQDIS